MDASELVEKGVDRMGCALRYLSFFRLASHAIWGDTFHSEQPFFISDLEIF